MGADQKRLAIADRQLTALVGKKIKAFLVNGKALDGTLVEYDAESLMIKKPGKTVATVSRVKITTFYEDVPDGEARRKKPVR